MRLCLQVFVNETKQRTFLVVCAENQPEAWVKQVAAVDAVMLRHHLEPFYRPPQVHVSLCWWPGDVSSEVQLHMHRLQQAWAERVGTWTAACGAPVMIFGHERHVLRHH